LRRDGAWSASARPNKSPLIPAFAGMSGFLVRSRL